MPANCNSLVRLDDDKEFCKVNCKWSFTVSGPKSSPKVKIFRETKKSKLKNPVPLSLVVEKDHLDFIKKQALQQSVKAGTIVHHNELIRQALQEAFPEPKQYDMFGGKK